MDLLLHHFWELTISGLAFGAVYALVALGYTLVYGVLRLINFAHSEVFMYGSFAAVWDDVLPPTPQDVWDENLRLVAGALERG